MYKLSCGLDVHKDSVFCCILGKNAEKNYESRFGTLTPELDRLRETHVNHGCGYAAMESTSIYWMPVWNILQHDLELKLVNPYFIKQLPGRKSDVEDAQRIANSIWTTICNAATFVSATTSRVRAAMFNCT
jgi:hypothetical protein